jgi:hypothetical protein
MRASLSMCVVAWCVMAIGAAAHARGPARVRSAKPSVSTQMNRLIGSVCNVELGNGAYAFRSYNPNTFKRKDAVKLIRNDMRNFESSGVRFRTATGPTQVKRQLKRALGDMMPDSVARLTKAIDGFKKLGVLQDVVYRGLSGGKAVGYSYFSIPHQVFFCLKTPTQKGKRLEVFMEYGD